MTMGRQNFVCFECTRFYFRREDNKMLLFEGESSKIEVKFNYVVRQIKKQNKPKIRGDL